MSLTGNPPIFDAKDSISDIHRAYMTWIIQNQTASSTLQALMQELATEQASSNTAIATSVAANSSKFDQMILDDANILAAILAQSMPMQANLYKTADTSTTGNTAAWTPATGKKFRLMAYSIEAPANLAINGVVNVTLKDGASTAMNMGTLIYAPLLSGGTAGTITTGWRSLGQGYLSTAVNNILNLNLDKSVTGTVRINMAGREE